MSFSNLLNLLLHRLILQGILLPWQTINLFFFFFCFLRLYLPIGKQCSSPSSAQWENHSDFYKLWQVSSVRQVRYLFLAGVSMTAPPQPAYHIANTPHCLGFRYLNISLCFFFSWLCISCFISWAPWILQVPFLTFAQIWLKSMLCSSVKALWNSSSLLETISLAKGKLRLASASCSLPV